MPGWCAVTTGRRRSTALGQKSYFVLGSLRTGEFRPSPVRSRKDPRDGQQIAGHGSPRLDGHSNDPCAMLTQPKRAERPRPVPTQPASERRPGPPPRALRVGAGIPRVAWTMATIG
jgi:hypothetical protein